MSYIQELLVNLQKCKKDLGIENINKKIVFVTGGSQGAVKFNKTILEMVANKLSNDFFVILVAGNKNYDDMMTEVKRIETEKDLETDESATIVLHTSNKKIEIKAESEDLDIDIPSGSDLVLGGFYVCPSFIGGGRVAYKLVGIAIKDENKWKLRTPFVGFQFNRSSESQEDAKKSQPNEQKHDIQDDEEDLGLTPIDEKAKKQKRSKK